MKVANPRVRKTLQISSQKVQKSTKLQLPTLKQVRRSSGAISHNELPTTFDKARRFTIADSSHKAQQLEKSQFIDRFYPHPSSSIITNKVPLPGDWDYNSSIYKDKARQIELGEELKTNEVNNSHYTDKMIRKLTRKINKQEDYEVEVFDFSKPKQDNNSNSKYLDWRQLDCTGSLPESTTCGSLTLVKNKLILIGGKTSTSYMHSLNINNYQWVRLSSQIPSGYKYGHTAVRYKKSIIVYGGKNKLEFDSKINVLNTNTFHWIRLKGTGKTPSPRKNHCACKAGRSMVVFGGTDTSSVASASTYMLDLKNFEWKEPSISGCKPPPRSLASLTAVFPSNYANDDNFQVSSYIYRVDNFSFDYGFYLFGGLSDQKEALDDFWVFKRHKQDFVWVKIEADDAPTARFSHTASFVNRMIIVIGGRGSLSSSQEICEIGVFYLHKMKWAKSVLVERLRENRWGHCAEVYENKIIIFGGVSFGDTANSRVKVLETKKLVSN